MYTKLIKFVVLLSLVLLSGFAGRVLYSPLLNRASQGRDPRHTYKLVYHALVTCVLAKRNQNGVIIEPRSPSSIMSAWERDRHNVST